MRYYIAVTKPQGERKAVQELSGLGYETYCPLEEVVKPNRGRGRERKIVRPLLPGYVALGAEWFDFIAIWACRNVSGLLSVAGEPIQVSQDVIEQIKAMAAIQPKRNIWQPGDEVNVVNSPWNAGVLKIDSLEDKHATIVMKAFGVERKVRVKQSQLRAA
jgi:transcription antitermination factor NusG